MEMFQIVVHEGKMKAVPLKLLRSLKNYDKLWLTKAKNEVEAEDKYCNFFCPPNRKFVNL